MNADFLNHVERLFILYTNTSERWLSESCWKTLYTVHESIKLCGLLFVKKTDVECQINSNFLFNKAFSTVWTNVPKEKISYLLISCNTSTEIIKTDEKKTNTLPPIGGSIILDSLRPRGLSKYCSWVIYFHKSPSNRLSHLMLKVCEPLALAHIMTVTWHYRWELGRENNVSPQLVEGDPLLLTMVSLDISFVSLSFSRAVNINISTFNWIYGKRKRKRWTIIWLVCRVTPSKIKIVTIQ